MEQRFRLVSEFEPRGDQPKAIEQLTQGVLSGKRYQTLLGATGTGKTFTIAHTIARVNRPTLVIAHNKTLAAQLCSEFKEFFPHNAVEYFVSYYDYYQPEAYIPSTDTYIEKDASASTTRSTSCATRRPAPVRAARRDHRRQRVLHLRPRFAGGVPGSGAVPAGRHGTGPRTRCCASWWTSSISATTSISCAGRSGCAGDVMEIFPASRSEQAVRVEFFGDEIERITEIDVLTGEIVGEREHVAIFPGLPLSSPANEMMKLAHRETSKRSWRSGWRSCAGRASCWRRSGWSSGPATTWK